MTILSEPGRALAPVTTRRRSVVRPARALNRLTRYRGGTYSHTVDRVVFTDGSWARTDLIRLNPNVHAYSLDFTGVAPRHPSRYRVDTWSALPHLRTSGHEARIGWILRHSFPMHSTAELSQQVREAGYPLGPANINEHEAIAATQAAIWFFTNRLTLDTRPLNVPVTVRRSAGPVFTFEFDGEPQLGGYSVWTDSPTAVNFKLQKSPNGVVWQDVSGSELTAGPGAGRHQRTLGQGSTLSSSSHGRGGRGYRYYRLAASSDTDTPRIGPVSFRLTGARYYRNADKVVHLYNYLLAQARKAVHETGEAALVDHRAGADGGLIGPFQVRIPLLFSANDGQEVVDTDGFTLGGPIEPGTDFYLRQPTGMSGITITAKTVGELHGRVLTGVALDEASHRFTPVALAIPTEMNIEFDISWQVDEAWSYVVGDKR